MGNSIDKNEECTIETSITSFVKCDDYYKIYLDPMPDIGTDESYFMLRKLHPDYENLAKKIILGITYKFTYKSLKTQRSLFMECETNIFVICHIEDREIKNMTHINILGIHGIEKKYKGICNKFSEVFIDKPGRFLVTMDMKKNNRLVKKIPYDILYVKFYRADFYLIIDINPTVIEEI
jgi:hypothetical protein